MTITQKKNPGGQAGARKSDSRSDQKPHKASLKERQQPAGLFLARTCGSCSMCCKVLLIDEVEPPKAAGQWCRHCEPGKGCSIYAKRPEGCRQYQCQWLLGHLPEWLYPERSKIVVDAVDIGDGVGVARINVDPSYPNRWQEEPYYSALKRLAQALWIGEEVATIVEDRGKLFWLTGQGASGWADTTFEQLNRMNGRVWSGVVS